MKKQTSQTSTADILVFGGPQQSYYPVQDSGGQVVSFRGEKAVNSIQIGSKRYGGPGGELQGTATLPASGVFTLKELRVPYIISLGSLSISYMKIKIEGKTIEVGLKRDAGDTVLQVDLQVRFAGIYCEEYIDKLMLEIIK